MMTLRPGAKLMSLLLGVTLVLGITLGQAAAAQALPLTHLPQARLPWLGEIFAGARPTTLGLHQGQLSPCPPSPNCVVSQGNPDASHAIAPLTYSGESERAISQLARLIAAMPRTQILEQTPTYLYAEFTSRWLGFVDDGEFYLDQPAGVIQVRSASRLGESDLGVNRDRIETLRQQLTTMDPPEL